MRIRKHHSNRSRICLQAGRCFLFVVLICSNAWLVSVNQRLALIQVDQEAEEGFDMERNYSIAVSHPQKNNQPMLVSQAELQRRYAKFRYRAPLPRNINTYDPNQECGTAPKFASFFEQSGKVRSFRNEDKTLYNLFFRGQQARTTATLSQQKPKEKFTYVELGAFNGVRESNTRFFDVCLEWTGLLIEANPLKYSKLLETRPHAHCLNYAPSCTKPQTIDFHSVSFTNAAQANVPNFYDNTSLVQVPCDRLTPTVVDILGGHVSFFSLDVEGAEAMVLQTIFGDFETKISVDVWMVENVNHFCPPEPKGCVSRDESRSILQHAGYVGYHSVVLGSDLFVRPNSRYAHILEYRFRSKHVIPPEPAPG